MNDKILVFVPAYKCAPQIGRVLAQFQGPITEFINEVLVIDNRSPDDTVEAALLGAPDAKVPQVTLVRNLENFNLGGSHKVAYDYAEQHGYTHVITLHGDNQGDINDILPVLRQGLHNRYDACMGARFTKGAKLTGYSLFRTVGNYAFNIVFSLAARRRITDMGSGLNLLASSAYANPALLRLPDDLYFNPYLVLDMIGRGDKVAFFPISWREEDQVSNVKMASQAMKTLGAAKNFALSRKRFRQRDYRTVKRDRYEFEVLARFVQGARSG